MPVDLRRLKEGWLELESDPGLFTLLLEDFGANGVQVEEIYDLQKPIEGPVCGFIFLFKWIEERRSRRKVVVTEESLVENEDVVNSIFFAQQIVPNSCATHALLSVLLNCSTIQLGPTLTRLKEYTKNMSPENKGYAIGNTPELARAHNSHAKSEPRRTEKTQHGITTGRTKEAFHFVSYVPINGHLFELDGLKPFPIDHGPWAEGEDWTEKFRRVMTERLGIATGGEPYHDIRFNLMAVVPDKRVAYEHKLRTLKTNRQIVLEALQQLVKLTHPELTCDDRAACMAAVRKTECDETQNLRTPVKHKSGSPFSKLPSALDSHNYAKSPLMEGVAAQYRPRYEEYSGSEYSDNDDGKQKPKADRNNGEQRKQAQCSTLSINADLMKPLSIQTKFHASPAPSASSTDTSSEAGSAFNSPVRTVNFTGSPNSAARNGEALLMEDVQEIKKFLVIRVTAGGGGDEAKRAAENVKRSVSSDSLSSESQAGVKRPCLDEMMSSDSNTSGGQEVCRITGALAKSRHAKHPRLIEPHKFAPKDLLALLKTVENEIAVCESNLRDEVEKRKKYKIDDCRRTHCYDQFLCTFLSMLTEQGKLTDLIEQQLVGSRRRQGIAGIGRLHRPTTRKPDKRRKTRRKNRKK